MVHYAEKELIKKRKKKYKPKDGQYALDAGLKKFGDKGETSVTKELQQFNTYNVFEPLDAKTGNTVTCHHAAASRQESPPGTWEVGFNLTAGDEANHSHVCYRWTHGSPISSLPIPTKVTNKYGSQ
jgi:hypothetical protein